MKKIPIILIILGFVLIGASSVLLITSNSKNNNTNPNDKTNEEQKKKESKLDFDGWTFTIPSGWTYTQNEDSYEGINVIFNTIGDGATYYNGSVFSIQKIASTGRNKESLFKDPTFFKEGIKYGNPNAIIDDGKLEERGGKPIIVFKVEYEERKDSKVLLAYMPADDEYFFDIKFYTNKVVNNNSEMVFNYDGLYLLADFLNTGKRK